MKKQSQEPEHPRFFTEKNGEFKLKPLEIESMVRSYYGVSSMKLITGETKCVVITRKSIINVMEDDVAIAYIRNLLLKREEVASLNNINLIIKINNTHIINKSFIKNLPENKLIHFYDKDMHKDEYLYYRNCAVRITEESITCVDYEDLPFYIFAEQILPYDFTLIGDYPLKPSFPLGKGLRTTTASGEESNSKYIKFLRDISNISWRNKNKTEEQKSIDDLSFFYKVMFLGYMLSHRTQNEHNKVFLIDSLNVSMGINKDYYALGKSLLCKFLNYGAVGATLCDNYPTSIASAITSHFLPSFIIVEDTTDENTLLLIHKEINEDTIIDSFPHSHYVLKKEQSPNVVAITSNLNNNMSNSIRKRVLEVPISDYYHTCNDGSGRYPNDGENLFEPNATIETQKCSTFEAMVHEHQLKSLIESLGKGSIEEQLKRVETLKSILQKEKDAYFEQSEKNDPSEELNDLFNLLVHCVHLYMLFYGCKNIY